MARFLARLVVNEQPCGDINGTQENRANISSLGLGMVYLTISGCVARDNEDGQILTILSNQEALQLAAMLTAAASAGIDEAAGGQLDQLCVDMLEKTREELKSY